MVPLIYIELVQISKKKKKKKKKASSERAILSGTQAEFLSVPKAGILSISQRK